MDFHPAEGIEEMTQAEVFRRVSDICATVNTVTDGPELLDVSLKKIMALFGANRGSIFLAEEGRKLALASSIGMERDEKTRMVKQMGQGIVGRVAANKAPIIVGDIANDERFDNFKARKNYNSPSFICAPLMIKDEVIGVISISNKVSGHKFKDEELQLLDFLSTQIALNYRRITLYRKFKSVVRETQSLKDKLGKRGREAERLKQQIFIQEKLATIGKLAGGIAHEFNNPLDGVMRYTNLSLEKAGEDEILRGYLMEIKQGLNRMAKIVKNLLACSRNEVQVSDRVNFYMAVDRCLALIKIDMSRKDIEVVKKIPEGIPELVDLGLERIMSNLILNAVDAIDKKGVITLEAENREGEIVLRVSDTGKGISADEVDKIFEPFFTTKDIGKGCGLGLTIVGEVVKAYDGKIEVESEIGHGTTFTVTLPSEKVL